MKSKSMTISGKYNSDGKLMISNKDEHSRFGQAWKNHRVLMVVTIYAEGNSRSQIGYYMNKIVPDFQKAYREIGELYTLKQTDEKLREMYPGCHVEISQEEAGGFNLVGLKSIYDLSSAETVDFLEYIRMIGAQEFGIDIEDPRRL